MINITLNKILCELRSSGTSGEKIEKVEADLCNLKEITSEAVVCRLEGKVPGGTIKKICNILEFGVAHPELEKQPEGRTIDISQLAPVAEFNKLAAEVEKLSEMKANLDTKLQAVDEANKSLDATLKRLDAIEGKVKELTNATG